MSLRPLLLVIFVSLVYRPSLARAACVSAKCTVQPAPAPHTVKVASSPSLSHKALSSYKLPAGLMSTACAAGPRRALPVVVELGPCNRPEGETSQMDGVAIRSSGCAIYLVGGCRADTST